MTSSTLEALRTPFPYASLGWSVGACSEDKRHGKAFPRLDPRDIQERLDAVVGADKWRTTYSAGPPEGGVFCTLELFIDGQWVAKSDIGYRAPKTSSAADKAGCALEVSLKASASDAFNRAAAMWGVGRYLYRFEPPYVELTHNGRALAAFPAMPDEFLPEQERGHEPWKTLQAALEEGAYWATRKGVSQPLSRRSRPSGQNVAKNEPKIPLRAVADKPPIGSLEQWQALSVEERREVAVLHNRLVGKTDLQAVENFLQSARGEALAGWARETLLAMLQKNVSAGKAPEHETSPADTTAHAQAAERTENTAESLPKEVLCESSTQEDSAEAEALPAAESADTPETAEPSTVTAEPLAPAA